MCATKLEGSEYRIHKVLKDLNNRAYMVIRGGRGTLYVSVPGPELGWLDKVTRDIGIKKQEIHNLPEHKKAPCGALVVNLEQHKGRCKACQALRTTVSAPKPQKAITVARIEPGQDFSLDGVISSLEATRNRVASQLEVVDNLLNNLKQYKDAKLMITELGSEVKGRVDAVKLLIQDGKLN